MKRMWAAMGGYAALALAAYILLIDPWRAVVWLFLGGLAVRTWARARYGAPE